MKHQGAKYGFVWKSLLNPPVDCMEVHPAHGSQKSSTISPLKQATPRDSTTSGWTKRIHQPENSYPAW